MLSTTGVRRGSIDGRITTSTSKLLVYGLLLVNILKDPFVLPAREIIEKDEFITRARTSFQYRSVLLG